MLLANQYYVDFLLNHKINNSNRVVLDEAIKYTPDLELSKIQMLQAMFITQVFPSVEIGIATGNKPSSMTVSILEDDAVFLLNMYVCKTEFSPEITSPYEKRRNVNAEKALNALLYQFKNYITQGTTRNKQTFPMNQ